MSWDASLYAKDLDGHNHLVKDWNYTHNCNAMMAEVLLENGHDLESHWLIGHLGKTWFDALNGKTGREGAELLSLIIAGMEADPLKFRAMNPANGWGDYDRVLDVLREMRDTSLEYPSAEWTVRG